MKKLFKNISLRRIILILLMFVLPLSGCNITSKTKFERGFGAPIGRYDLIQIGATSSTNTFPADSVSFEIYYGFEQTKTPAERRLASYKYENEQVIFATYILKGSEYDLNFSAIAELEDCKSIDDCIFIRDISQEEAITDEYTYKFSDPWWLFLSTKYNHSETLTVPEEVFSQQQGKFCFVIIAFYFVADENMYHAAEIAVEQFSYVKQDKTVEIIF